ncbi:NUDIX hydrolase [Arcticibacterium luteifluviistationis]|uniref:NUDIX hydrolase n=1 Tax=Arcticibacterium luteifluviistationis TaxID=1784714 RepID=A0A2Z4G9A7_9BACT|nr:NUDIX domain-containing protein [Arcticibacterium luteifluviistationis]AWV97734.1 NUDIX hydrolase [Arcticibacterium luteifluviistationis]
MAILDGESFLPNLAFDSVVFGFSGGSLKILIMEYHNTGLFALPGGFVKFNEDLNEAVKRGLKERTGLEDIYLEQFYTFGNFKRNQTNDMRTILKTNEVDLDKNAWLLDRMVSVAYYALINYEDVVPKPDYLSDSCEWYDVEQLPDLIQDHKDIVEKALETLRVNIDRKLIGVNLLPQKFTMKELQGVYEAILGEKLRRTSFQRKILGLSILERHEKQFSGAANKAPFLYSFSTKKETPN